MNFEFSHQTSQSSKDSEFCSRRCLQYATAVELSEPKGGSVALRSQRESSFQCDFSQIPLLNDQHTISETPNEPITGTLLNKVTQFSQVAQLSKSKGYPGVKKQKQKKKLTKEEASRLYQDLNRQQEAARKVNKPSFYTGTKEAEDTVNDATTMSGGKQHSTPFGKATVTYSGTGQVMISSRKDNYPGKYSGNFKAYVDWAKELDKTPKHRQQFAQDLLSASKEGHLAPINKKIYSNEQLRAAASLVSVFMSEEFRVDGARKLGRAALRLIDQTNYTFLDVFGETGIYPLVGTGGTDYTRSLMTGARTPNEKEIELIGSVSPPHTPHYYD
jgi:hypothetical protein